MLSYCLYIQLQGKETSTKSGLSSMDSRYPARSPEAAEPGLRQVTFFHTSALLFLHILAAPPGLAPPIPSPGAVMVGDVTSGEGHPWFESLSKSQRNSWKSLGSQWPELGYLLLLTPVPGEGMVGLP